MTTIAWDGKTLAADTRNSAGGMPFTAIKAHRLVDGRLFAGSGSADDCIAVREWLEKPGEKKPELKDFTGLLIENGCCYRIEDKLMKNLIEGAFHACGSGRDYAMAAMHYGKSAREAVELACLYDIYTGAPITELQPEEKLSTEHKSGAGYTNGFHPADSVGELIDGASQ